MANRRIVLTEKVTDNMAVTPDEGQPILEEILELTRSNAKTLVSDQRNISRFTVEELVSNFRRIKDNNPRGSSLDLDLAQLESTIIRLCKESNLEDIYFRYHGLRRYSTGGGMYRAKNSVSEPDLSLHKRRVEERIEAIDKQ